MFFLLVLYGVSCRDPHSIKSVCAPLRSILWRPVYLFPTYRKWPTVIGWRSRSVKMDKIESDQGKNKERGYLQKGLTVKSVSFASSCISKEDESWEKSHFLLIFLNPSLYFCSEELNLHPNLKKCKIHNHRRQAHKIQRFKEQSALALERCA